MVKVGFLGLVVEVLCVLGILDVAQSPRISLSILIVEIWVFKTL